MTFATRMATRITQSETGCWLWTGSINSQGYGRLKWAGRQVQAHRAAYEELVGPIPDGLTIDHLCRVRNCVNPAHLEPVTQRENTLRGTCPAAMQARQERCKNNHSLSPENTYVWRRMRRCRTCRNARERAQRAARGRS